MELKYLKGYPEEILEKIRVLIKRKKLGEVLLKKYPENHDIKSNKELYNYIINIKNQYLKKSQVLSKVEYCNKIEFNNQALGLHTFKPLKQGKKIKMKNEIRISTLFKNVPEEFLRNIVVHELAHFKEKEHNKSFYKLCCHMEPNYAQIEFDIRLYLTYRDIDSSKLWT